MPEDKLTRNERIRLESLAQAISFYQMKQMMSITQVLQTAEQFEEWLKKADIKGNN